MLLCLKASKFLLIKVALHHLLLVEVRSFRETDIPDADLVLSDEQDGVIEQISSSSTVFILPCKSIQARILSRLDKKIPPRKYYHVYLFKLEF